MLPENAFTEKEENELRSLNLTVEMAVASEWIVRDEGNPDSLLICFVAATDEGHELQGACSCVEGSKNQPCPHLVAVFREIRGQNHILHQILSSRARPPQLIA